MDSRLFSVPLVASALATAVGTIGPAYTWRLGDMSSKQYLLWSTGYGFACVGVAIFVVLFVAIWLAQNAVEWPVAVLTLFGFLTLLLLADFAYLRYESGPQSFTPGWGLWLSTSAALLGTVFAFLWFRSMAKIKIVH